MEFTDRLFRGLADNVLLTVAHSPIRTLIPSDWRISQGHPDLRMCPSHPQSCCTGTGNDFMQGKALQDLVTCP